MRIIIVSDNHGNQNILKILYHIYSSLYKDNVKFIHLGDSQTTSINDLNNFICVKGNNDTLDLPKYQRLTVLDKRIHFSHGDEGLDEIKKDLNLIEKLEDNPVSIEWFSSNYNLIGYDGKVYNDDLKKDQKEEVTLTANLQYMEYSSSYEIKVIVCGRELTHEEQLKKDIFYEIKCAQSDYNSDYVELPKEVDGEEVIYKKRESGNYAAAVLFCGISLAIFAHYHDKEKKNSYEKEKIKQMKCDYPEIVAKLSLLVGAGMTVRMAWEKIVVDYRVRQKSGPKKRYAYEFMSEGLNMLKSGKPQIYVYEEFGMKCGIKEYMKFSSLIVQNIKKGTKELALLLTLEAKDAFEERKNMAKKYGEEAGTKLLLPMIIMLIVVMAIIMVPALMSFSGY